MTHQATVTVVNGQVQVSDAKLKPKGKPATLVWTLATPGYVFTSNGIAITGNNGQFSNPAPSSGNTVFSWQDANTDALEYAYNIAVQLAGQPHGILRLDPTIQNTNTYRKPNPH